MFHQSPRKEANGGDRAFEEIVPENFLKLIHVVNS